MNVAIIGCGLIGQKRAKALAGAKLVAVSDAAFERAQAMARTIPGVQAVEDWRSLMQDRAIELVVVATTNDALAEITLAAVEAGKHVLVEKPAARNAAELQPIIEAARRNNVRVRVGFN